MSPTREDLQRLLWERKDEFLKFVRRRVRDDQTAEDLFQETLLRALERSGQLEEGDAAAAWFYRALRNAVVDHYRRRGASEKALENLGRELDDPEREPLPDERNHVCRCVHHAKKALKPEYAAALERVHEDGVPVKDFAQEQGISANNAAVRVFRARAALKEAVEVTCGACAEAGCVDCTCGT